jgi:hypothetical protein
VSRRGGTVGCPHCLPGPQNPASERFGWQAGWVPDPAQRETLTADGELAPASEPGVDYAVPWRPCLCHPSHKPWLDGDLDNTATRPATKPARDHLRVV